MQGAARRDPYLDADAPACGADAWVDDGEHDAGAEVWYGPHQSVAPGPDVERRYVVGEVDDHGARGTRRDHGVDDADELVRCAEVGEEEDGGHGIARHSQVLSAAGCATARWRPPPPP